MVHPYQLDEITISTGKIDCSGDITIGSASFTTGYLYITFTGAGTLEHSGALNINNKATVGSADTAWIHNQNGAMTCTDVATYNAPNATGTWASKANIDFDAGTTFNVDLGTLYISKSSITLTNDSDEAFNNITIDTSGVVTQGSAITAASLTVGANTTWDTLSGGTSWELTVTTTTTIASDAYLLTNASTVSLGATSISGIYGGSGENAPTGQQTFTSTLDIISNGTMYVSTYAIGNGTSVADVITNSGTITCGATTILTLNGDFINTNIFIKSTSTVNMTGTGAHVLSGTNDFNNLSIQITANADYTVSGTQTITGSTILDGHTGQILTLTQGTLGVFNISGSQDLDYLIVINITATGNTMVAAHSSGSGTTTGWVFPSSIYNVYDNNSGDGLESTDANWSGGVSPGATDSIYLGAGSNTALTLTQSHTAGSLFISSAYTATVTITHNQRFNGGSIYNWNFTKGDPNNVKLENVNIYNTVPTYIDALNCRDFFNQYVRVFNRIIPRRVNAQSVRPYDKVGQ